MASGLDVQTDPVFWWWEEDGGSRVVLLTDALLILSGSLTDEALAELEAARRAGTVEAADFGADSCRISVGAIECLRYVPDSHRLEVDLAGGGRFDVEPPRSNAGVALGVFDTLAKRLAPGHEPEDSHAGGVSAAEDPALTVVGAMVVLGLVCLGLAVAADQGQPAGPLSGVRTSLNDLFAQLGYVPALALFAIATLVQMKRIRSDQTDESDTEPVRAARVLKLDLRGLPTVASPVPVTADPLADIATPAGDDAAAWTEASVEPSVADGSSWSPPEATGAWGEAEDSWSAPEPSVPDEAPVQEPSSDEADVQVETWVGDVAEDASGDEADVPVETWVGDVAEDASGDEDQVVDHPSADLDDHADDDTAWADVSVAVEVETHEELLEDEDEDEDAVAAPADAVGATGDVEAEFWSQSKRDLAQDPWWERDDAADAGDPGTLPPPPPVADPVEPASVVSPVEPVAPSVEAPAAEVVEQSVEVADGPAERRVASSHEAPTAPAWGESDEVHELEDSPPVAEAPAPDLESAPPAVDTPATEPEQAWPPLPDGPAAAVAAVPAPDSPFAEILDREAPLPAWASAPEPTNQLVDRDTMERSIPASLLPEAADID